MILNAAEKYLKKLKAEIKKYYFNAVKTSVRLRRSTKIHIYC